MISCVLHHAHTYMYLQPIYISCYMSLSRFESRKHEGDDMVPRDGSNEQNTNQGIST